MSEKLRVAVAGASGIGKHHAKWYHMAGCEVVGFLGSSRESCAETEQVLKSIFPFRGRGYWEWEELLEKESPDIADVCVPNEMHAACVLGALKKGCHVLCEKPLVWHRRETIDTILEQTRSLVECARKERRKLGVCTQYAASLPHYMRLYEPARGALEQVARFYAEMETLSRGRRRSAADIWVDMGPHPLSLLLAWIPAGEISPDSLQVEFSGSGVRALFDFVSGETVCRSEIVVRDRASGNPVRRFGVNDFIVECEGRNDEQGIFRSVLRSGQKSLIGADFMSLLISQFVEAVQETDKEPLVSGEVGLRNLELQTQILRQVEPME